MTLNGRRRFAEQDNRKEAKLGATRRICVIFNPSAARGRADARLRTLQDSLGPQAEFRATKRAGHAEELALAAAREGFDVVAAAGGDGTVHEVANGLLRAEPGATRFAVLPLGSANDYAYSLQRTQAIDGFMQLDVGQVRDERGRERFFVNTLGLGFSGAVALESRRIQWLQGLMLYGLAFLRALCFRFACPTLDCKFDSVPRTAPTLSLTVALGIREGSFIVAREARLDDGLFDYVHAGPMSRWEAMRFLPKLASGAPLPTDNPALWLGTCKAVQIRSESALTVHLDGEFFSQPEDNVRTLDIAMLPGRLPVVADLLGEQSRRAAGV